MVLDQGLVDAAMWGDPETIWDWLQSLDRPEDINEVDMKGRTALRRSSRSGRSRPKAGPRRPILL